MDFDDSHEWTMWKAKDALTTGGHAKYSLPVVKQAITVAPAGMEIVQSPPALRQTPKPKMTREEYNQKRRERKGKVKGKNAWAVRLQTRVNAWVKGSKDPELQELLGYSSAQLRRHLERQFRKGMTWTNYAGNKPFKAKGTWVIDHIVPKRLFLESEASNAFHVTNLRPLWLKENMAKGASRDRLI